jgi:hypothetical protein
VVMVDVDHGSAAWKVTRRKAVVYSGMILRDAAARIG